MEIRESTHKFFTSIGFKIEESDTSKYFGNYYDVYTNQKINFRLVNDRSIKSSIDVSNDCKNWYDLTLVKALLYHEKNLNYVMTIEESIFFLQNELINIAKLFNDKNYLTTRKRLEELRNERVKQMFPTGI